MGRQQIRIVSKYTIQSTAKLCRAAQTLHIKFQYLHSISTLTILAKALDASCVLPLVDGTRAIPRATTSNSSGHSAKSIVPVEDPDGIHHNVVMDEDDCYRYYAEKLLAFNFMITMINKDMLHILQVPIKEKNPIKLYQMILNYFKGNNHHVERARILLAQHRLSNGDIVRDLSHLKLLINNLAQAQGSDLP